MINDPLQGDVMSKTQPVDADATARILELRGAGHSFAGIAEDVGLARAIDAFDAFVRALKGMTPAERKALKKAEGSRLDVLEKRTRAKAAPDKLEKKLTAIANLRKQLAKA
jgi:hypothetical protein